MDRAWTYRPPVLVGERVVWVRGDEGKRSPRLPPHHGTVAWMGRLPDTASQWTVGIQFVSTELYCVAIECCTVSYTL